jgi:hypothetical protein
MLPTVKVKLEYHFRNTFYIRSKFQIFYCTCHCLQLTNLELKLFIDSVYKI